MSELLRVYEPEECGVHRGRRSMKSSRSRPALPLRSPVGYPHAWSKCPRCFGCGYDGSQFEAVCTACLGAGSIKDLIRQQAEHRCVRCGHPYVVGESGEWAASAMPPPSVPQASFPDLPAEAFEIKPGRDTNWSDCDGECRHDGPVRYLTDKGAWHVEPNKLMGWTTGDLWRDHPDTAKQARPQAAWRILTVHHLNEIKADCRWWNLAALCQRCHLYIQRKVQMEQIYPFPHSAWFRPYAAGYYASAYLEEELTRVQTEGRIDELLALEAVT